MAEIKNATGNVPRAKQAILRAPTGRIFVGGEWIESAGAGLIDSINPATGQVNGVVVDSTEEDLERAVISARRALDSSAWKKMPPQQRGKMLHKLASLLDANRERLAVLESMDNGKPIRETRAELDGTIACFEFFAGTPDKLRGSTIPAGAGRLNYTLREPVGVVGQIIPWNSPMLMLSWKVAPALACGNTIVLKPAEDTSLTALEFAFLMQEADLPQGVVNVITGVGERSGSLIARHPGIDAVAFTGHHVTGQAVVANSAGNLKKVALELGGKSPNIVFDDADLDSAVNAAVAAAFKGQGQSCAAGSRLFLQKGIKDRFLEKLCAQAGKIRVGDPLDEATEMGPVINEVQLNKVQNCVNKGVDEGASIALGGRRRSDELLRNGFYFPPTVLDSVSSAMSAARDEIFGPVVSIIEFDDEEDVIRQANDVIYGLTGAVWTRDIGRANRIASAINFGTVWINTYKALSPSSPYGGFKMSGYGKDNGLEALDFYSRLKSVWLDIDGGYASAYGKSG